ncbi:hypothetical protein [Paraburkholderia terrae]|uniref:hypothetical protein n=1 Tax=Paraburkholderia terrae TaxID=311230 RepID=UPI00206D1C9E|nr:hypothetical protein [Paraburkholderia terrae]BDC39917.1 hypothetical protein PTKU15_32140 [Paraburkholderia terrae]
MSQVQSFDIFDTLIARRCGDPKAIFFQIEHRLKLDGFAQQRIAAEASLQTGSYTLDDIYATFQNMTGLNPTDVESIKQLEIDVELDNVIPIVENMRKVNNGDLLISDMYLPPEVIRKLLRKAGFKKHVGLIVTADGKSSGRIWPLVRERLTIQKHVGDNLRSDVSSPISNGIYGEHLNNSAPNNHESFLTSNGFARLSNLVRELRLRFLEPASGQGTLQKKSLQFSNNIPFLILAATYINNIADKLGVQNIAFCSRDCLYLYNIYNALFPSSKQPVADYFYTSRYARVKGSTDYLSYFKSVVTEKTLVVDMCGTGWSLGQLYANIGIQPPTLLVHFLSDRENAVKQYGHIRQYVAPKELGAIVQGLNINNTVLELLNYTEHGMVEDVVYFDNLRNWHPVLEEPDYPAEVLESIEAIQDAQAQFEDVLNDHDVSALLDEIRLNEQKIPGVMVELYKDMANRMEQLRDLWSYHVRQDTHTMWKLNQLK